MKTREAHDCPECPLVYYSKGALTRHIKDEHPTQDNLDLSTKFLLKYQDLGKQERRQTILMFNGQPFTWNPIWLEVYNKTAMATAMLKQLEAEGKL